MGGTTPAAPWHGGFGLYVHWPYCQSKCPYCDFNSHVGGQSDPALWAEAYGREIRRLAAETGPRPLDSIFFGGGTPSLMPPEVVGAVIQQAHSWWGFTNRIEITLEANPGSADMSRFQGYRAAGVNRVSVGVQSLRDADLKLLGRKHSVAEARAAVAMAQDLFERVSLDLIYARQNQRPEDWAKELDEALAFGTTHLSLYQLTIEPGTVFARRHAAGALRGLPDESPAADMYEITQDICAAAGIPAYEVSNHAVPGAECRHNLIYWTAGDWAGIGPGAHGRLTLGGQRVATETPLLPSEWLRKVSEGSGEVPRSILNGVDQAREYLISGLRCHDGISLRYIEGLLDRALVRAPIVELATWGLVEHAGGAEDRLRPTPQGLAVLDSVIRHLDRAWLP